MQNVSLLSCREPARRGESMKSDPKENGMLAKLALRFTYWAERWYPDAYVFVALVVVVVAAAAMLNGASPVVVAKSFGDGFWSLIVFTLQVSMIAINGYVVAVS